METKFKITIIMISMLSSVTPATPVTPTTKIDSRTGALHIPEKIIGGVIDIVQNHNKNKPTNQQVQANFQLQQQQGYQPPAPGYQYPPQWNNQLYQNQLQAQYQAQLQAQAQYGNSQTGYPINQGNYQQNNNNYPQNGGSQFEAQAQFVSQTGSYVGAPINVGSGFPQNQGGLQNQNQNQFPATQTGFPSQPIQVTNNQMLNQGQNQYQSGSQGIQGQNQYQSGNQGSQGQNQYQSGANGGQMSQNQYQQMSGNNGQIQQTSNNQPSYQPAGVTNGWYQGSQGTQGGVTQGPVTQPPGPVNSQNHYVGSNSGSTSQGTNQQVSLSQSNQVSQGQYQQTTSQGSSGYQVSSGHQVSGSSGGPTCVCQAWSKPPNDEIDETIPVEETTIKPDPKKKE